MRRAAVIARCSTSCFPASCIPRGAKTQAGKDCTDVRYYHGTNTDSDAAVKKLLGARYHRLDVGQPKPAVNPVMLDNAGRPILDAKGHPVHRFNADPHNYTIGAFMDDLGHPNTPHGLSGRS